MRPAEAHGWELWRPWVNWLAMGALVCLLGLFAGAWISLAVWAVAPFDSLPMAVVRLLVRIVLALTAGMLWVMVLMHWLVERVERRRG